MGEKDCRSLPYFPKYSDSPPKEIRLPDSQRYATSGSAVRQVVGESLRLRQSDHPAIIPKECYALVVSPCIDGYDFSKCLLDGGASLNIMYLETLEKMNLTRANLKHSTIEFHSVFPGRKGNSLGCIKLLVSFGNINNYPEEMINFE